MQVSFGNGCDTYAICNIYRNNCNDAFGKAKSLKVMF